MNLTEFDLRTELKSGRYFDAGEKHVLAVTLALIRPAEKPRLAAMDAEIFGALNRALITLALIECSRALTPKEEKRRETVSVRAARLAAIYGLRIETSSDPRGHSLIRLLGEPLSFAHINPSEGLAV